VQWAHKKYKSHRVVEEWVFADIDVQIEKEAKEKAKIVLNVR
jgi:hypothetical protein